MIRVADVGRQSCRPPIPIRVVILREAGNAQVLHGMRTIVLAFRAIPKPASKRACRQDCRPHVADLITINGPRAKAPSVLYDRT